MTRPLSITNFQNRISQTAFGPPNIQHIQGFGFDVFGNGQALVESNPGFAFGTNDFTLEMFFQPFDKGTVTLFDFRTSSQQQHIHVEYRGSDSNNELEVSFGNTLLLNAGSVPFFFGDPSFLTHIAVVRENGTLKTFVDGNLTASTSFTNSLPQAPCSIASDFQRTSQSQYDGQFEEVRISPIARYSNNFSPAYEVGFIDDADTSVLIQSFGPEGSTTVEDTADFEPPGEIKEFNADLTAQATLAATARRLLPLDSTLETTATLAADTNVIKTADALLTAQAEVFSEPTRIVQLAAEFESLFTPDVTVNAVRFVDALFEIFANIETAANLIADIDSVLENIVNLSLQGNRTAGLSASLPSSADLTAESNLIKNIDSTFESITNFSLQGDRLAGLSSELPAFADLTAESNLIKNIDAELNSISNLDIQATVGESSEVLLNSEFNLDAESGIIKQFIVNIDSAADFNLTANLILRKDVELNSVTSLNADAVLTTDTQADLASQTQLAATATGNFTANADLVAEADVTANITVQFTLEQTLDTVTSLQASLTQFAVNDEQIYTIRPEERTFVIQP